MGKAYSTKDSNLHFRAISAGHMATMGRLIRLCSEIETLTVGYIAKLSGGSYDLVELMLGRTAIKRRVDLAGQLARAKGAKTWVMHRQMFGASWENLNRVRNAIAHGSYVGLDDDGRYTFITQDLTVAADQMPKRTSLGIRGNELTLFVKDARHIARLLRAEALPAPWHDRSNPPSLARHPKGQRRG